MRYWYDYVPVWYAKSRDQKKSAGSDGSHREVWIGRMSQVVGAGSEATITGMGPEEVVWLAAIVPFWLPI